MKFNAQTFLAELRQGAGIVEKVAQEARALPGVYGLAATIVDKAAEAVRALAEEGRAALADHDAVTAAPTLDAIEAVLAKVDAEVEALGAQVAAR